jgi:hypothetical protein
MPKLKSPQNVPNESTPPGSTLDSWSGPWGKINPSPESVFTLRLNKEVTSSKEESFSYPYRNLSSWKWRRDFQAEELRIQAGPDLITIRGKGLIRLVDALDAGSLVFVRESPRGSVARLENATEVDSLVVDQNNGS